MSKDKKDQGLEGQFSLEDILTEFGGGSTRRREETDEASAVPTAPPKRKKSPEPPKRERPPEPKASELPKREKAPEPKASEPPKREKAPEPKAPDTPRRERGSGWLPRQDKPPEPPTKREKAPEPAAVTPKRRDNVVVFPGSAVVRDPPPRAEAETPAPERPKPEKAPPKGEDPGNKVVEFPEEEREESFFAAKLETLRKKADEYADHMYEHAGVEARKEVRTAEKYIPGVDVEEEPTSPIRRERRPRRRPPPAPDYAPGELARRYGSGLRLLELRTALVFLLALPMLYITVLQYVGAPLPDVVAGSYERQVYALAIFMGAAMLLGIDQLVLSLGHMFLGHMGLDALVGLACVVTLIDALTVVSRGGRGGQLPYCGVCVLALAASMWGACLKRKGQRMACRTAAAAKEPYVVTLDENRWNNRDAYAKWSGETAGFGSQIQADDGAARIFRVTAPLMLVACVVFAMLASIGRERPAEFLWCLSATLTASATFSGTLCFGMPWAGLCRRLSKSGAALAGWEGAVGAGGGVGILLTDTDLFPPGAVNLNGIKVFGEFAVEKVVSCAASLIRQSGSGLERPFYELLRSQGGLYRRCDDFRYHEGGGLSAEVRGEQVLVGSASFMHLSSVALPQGLNVKNAVFCAINGELAGIFALSYTLHPAVQPSLTALIRNRIGPVMATRDFNLTPAMLRQRFKLPVDRMEYPAVERRVELSDNDAPHNPILSAVLCREGLTPFSEAVVGAKRLCTAVRWSSVLAAVGSAVGAVLAFYLSFMEAYASLSPSNLLIFLTMWTIPTLLISGWVDRY